MSSKNVKGRGRPPVDSERVDTRLARDILNALDTFSADKNCKTRPEAIRQILSNYLRKHGYLKP